MKPTVPSTGRLRDTPFARIVGHQARTSATGAVEIHRPAGIDRAFFMHGVPQGASTFDNRVRIGDVLVSMNAVSPQAVEAAVEHQRNTGGLLGNVLVDQGAVSEEVLESAFAKQSHLTFLSFFDGVDLPYEIRDGLVELTNFRPMPMMPMAAIYRGLRDHAPMEICLQMLGRFAFSRLILSPRGTELVTQLSPVEKNVAVLLATPLSTVELAEQTKLPPKAVAALLLALDELGGIDTTPAQT